MMNIKLNEEKQEALLSFLHDGSINLSAKPNYVVMTEEEALRHAMRKTEHKLQEQLEACDQLPNDLLKHFDIETAADDIVEEKGILSILHGIRTQCGFVIIESF